jgi:hypothetical protein
MIHGDELGYIAWDDLSLEDLRYLSVNATVWIRHKRGYALTPGEQKIIDAYEEWNRQRIERVRGA